MERNAATAACCIMAEIGFEGGVIWIEASILGNGLGLDASAVTTLMHDGAITSLCEQGVDQDAGRYRLTFFYRSRRFRLTLDEAGQILQRSTIDFGDRPLPPALRKPGT